MAIITSHPGTLLHRQADEMLQRLSNGNVRADPQTADIAEACFVELSFEKPYPAIGSCQKLTSSVISKKVESKL